jgi:hypothetical protein
VRVPEAARRLADFVDWDEARAALDRGGADADPWPLLRAVGVAIWLETRASPERPRVSLSAHEWTVGVEGGRPA